MSFNTEAQRLRGTKMVRLGEVCEEFSLRNRDGCEKSVYSVTNSEGFVSSTDYFSKEVYSKDLTTYKLVETGMFAYNPSRINVGSVSCWRGNGVAVISPLYVVFKINDKILDSRFLEIFLHSSIALRQIKVLTSGSVRDSLKFSAFRNIQLPLPSLEEQRRIAGVLDRISEMKRNVEARIKKLDLLVKARFSEMFGDPIKNEKGFHEIKLEEVTTKIGSGATPKGGKESYQAIGISLIRSMNVHDGKFKYDDLAHLSDAQAKELNNVEVMTGDVLLNITGASVARTCIVPNDVLPARVNQHVAIIRPNNKIISLFLNSLLIYPTYKRLLLGIGESGGATRQAITKQQLLTLKLPLPPLPLQREFAGFVEKVESLKAIAKKELEKVDLLYRAKLQEFFG